MIDLDFTISPSRKQEAAEWCMASEGDLRYDAVLGSVIFRIDSVDLSARWGWIPLLDFALCLQQVALHLGSDESEAKFEFTESSDVIRFARTGSVIHVSCTYAVGVADVPLDAFRTAVVSFAHRLVCASEQAFPSLRRSAAYVDVREMLLRESL
jgi:hypothetical protein